MPETKPATKPAPMIEMANKAIIIKDPESGILNIAVMMPPEGSESTEAGSMDTLVDFIQTFINPEKKPESGLWSKDQNPCPFQCQCRTREESAAIATGITSPEPGIRLRTILRKIGLALHSSHNTLVTDLPVTEPSETSWRIDNAEEIKMLEELEALLLSTDTCPLCGRSNRHP